MTVKELIDELQSMKNQDARIAISFDPEVFGDGITLWNREEGSGPTIKNVEEDQFGVVLWSTGHPDDESDE